MVQSYGKVEGSDKCDDFATGQTAPVELDGRGDYELDVEIVQECSCGATDGD